MSSTFLQNSPKLQSHPLAADNALTSDTESEASLPVAASPRVAAAPPRLAAASPRTSTSAAASEQDTLEAPDSAAPSARAGRAWLEKFAPDIKTGSPAAAAALPKRATQLPALTLPAAAQTADAQTATASHATPASPHPVPPSNPACMQWVSEGLGNHVGEAANTAPGGPKSDRSHQPVASLFVGAAGGAILGIALGLGIGAIAAVAGLGLTGFFTAVAVGLCMGALIGCSAAFIVNADTSRASRPASGKTSTAAQPSAQSPQPSPAPAKMCQEV